MGSMEDMKEIVNNNNNNNNNDITDEFIKNIDGVSPFYAGATVFVTGGTGFVGKALIEKLLRSFEDVDAIYILMRPKNGHSVEQRFKDLIKNLVFDRIRSKKPELFEKIKPVQGDVSEVNVGLNQHDQELLSEKVNIVIHSAATIRFVEPLTDALNLNTLGTKRMLDLSYRFKNLKSFVYVSTAYSNVDVKVIEEKVYPPMHNPNTLLQCFATLSKETINAMAPNLQGKHPNTYTFTKNLAEDIVLQYSHKLPVCIVRPSIVTPAYNEPYPGWVDNLFGVTGIVMEIYRGTIRTGTAFHDYVLDIVPVDIVVNTCIAAAWHHKLNSNSDVVVYNCTSGDVQKFTWGKFTNDCVETARIYPSKYTMLYPKFHLTRNRLLNTFWEIFTHLLPAFIFDLLLRVQGKKPIMLKLTRRFKMALLAGEYFAQNQWEFSTENYKSLIKSLASTGDNAYLPCDMNIFNCKDYAKIFILGIRKFLLKDTMDTLPAAKKKIQRLYIFQKILEVISGYYIFRFLFRRK